MTPVCMFYFHAEDYFSFQIDGKLRDKNLMVSSLTISYSSIA
jgi:hypothetical protein